MSQRNNIYTRPRTNVYTNINAIVKQVTQASNSQLNSIPQNIIGPVNPVDITTGNNGPVQITNNIDGIIQQQLLAQTTDKIVTKLQSQLRLSLPTDKLGIINFDALAASLVQGITPTVGKTITTAVGGFADAVFGRNQQPKVTTTNIETLYSTLPPEEALTKTDEIFASSAANSALTEAKNFDINSTENKEKLEVLEKGFTDPNANYPTKEYAGISETNKLAQGDSRGTVVTEKNKNRMKGAKLPGGEAWDEPESAFRGAYPYNKVTQTESGHIIEIDDTPGSERLHIYHKSGTYIEIDANGSMVKRTKGSLYEIIDRNGKISIAGRADISVNGACNIFVGNDANIEVEGDTNITCHNDITAQAGGTFNLSAVEEFNIRSKTVRIEADENMHVRADSAITLQAKFINNKASESINDTAVNRYTSVTGEVSVAGDNIYLDSDSDIHWNSGLSTKGVLADAERSAIGILSGRKDITDNNKDDPQVLSQADSRSIALEEETQTVDDFNNQKNLIISEGFANAAEITEPPAAVDNTIVESEQGNFVEPDIKLKTVTQLPGNYNLSPNFTVEMLSNKAAVTRDSIRGHAGASYGDIVYNLQAVALNILEPVKKIYPNMFVTSAFRDPGNASNAKTSQHPLGQGVDIQFKGITKKEYYDIATKLAKVLKYDQLILEYCSYTKNPWIHVSYSVKNRSQVLTFYNHKTHSQGLTQLA